MPRSSRRSERSTGCSAPPRSTGPPCCRPSRGGLLPDTAGRADGLRGVRTTDGRRGAPQACGGPRRRPARGGAPEEGPGRTPARRGRRADGGGSVVAEPPTGGLGVTVNDGHRKRRRIAGSRSSRGIRPRAHSVPTSVGCVGPAGRCPSGSRAPAPTGDGRAPAGRPRGRLGEPPTGEPRPGAACRPPAWVAVSPR